MKELTFWIIFIVTVVDVFGGQFYDTSKGTKYYIETLSKFSWFEAYFECIYRNMTLFTYESQAQFDDLYALLRSDKFTDKPPDLWLGAIGTKGKFVWIKTGLPMTAHHLWSSGNPDNGGDIENCLHIWKHRQVFNDWQCSGQLGFICETDDVKDKLCNCDGARTGKYNGLNINFVNQRN